MQASCTGLLRSAMSEEVYWIIPVRNMGGKAGKLLELEGCSGLA